MATIQFQFSFDMNQKIFASANGQPKFYVGKEVIYQGNHGLSNEVTSAGLIYNPTAFEAKHSHWAWFIYPTAIVESGGSFYNLNTYDSAFFTFSFLQYAAHVPNGDFVQYFKAILQLPNAKDYFPFLELKNGNIFYNNGTTVNQLESSTSTANLMKYLNPDLVGVDNQEKTSAARMIHWASNDVNNRNIQVEIGIALFKKMMQTNNTRYNLNGMPDYICQVICDIHHQGRAKVSFIQSILLANSSLQTKYANLLNIGVDIYTDRIKVLKAKHNELKAAGKLGTKKWSATANDFVNM
jgi:hypothetical protein